MHARILKWNLAARSVELRTSAQCAALISMDGDVKSRGPSVVFITRAHKQLSSTRRKKPHVKP